MKKVLTGTDGSSIISYVATHKRCEARIDAWLSLVERCVRDAEVAGSNPVASIGKGNIYDVPFFNRYTELNL